MLNKTKVFYGKVRFYLINQAYPMKVCSSLLAQIQAGRLRFKPGGWDSSLQAQIQAWRLRSKPTGSDWSLEALISLRKPTWPRCARSIGDLICFQRMYRVCSSLLAQIQAWRLRFKPGGWSTSMAWARSLPKTSRILVLLVLLVLLVFWRFYWFFQETISFAW